MNQPGEGGAAVRHASYKAPAVSTSSRAAAAPSTSASHIDWRCFQALPSDTPPGRYRYSRNLSKIPRRSLLLPLGTFFAKNGAESSCGTRGCGVCAGLRAAAAQAELSYRHPPAHPPTSRQIGPAAENDQSTGQWESFRIWGSSRVGLWHRLEPWDRVGRSQVAPADRDANDQIRRPRRCALLLCSRVEASGPAPPPTPRPPPLYPDPTRRTLALSSFFAVALPAGYVAYHAGTGTWLDLKLLLDDGEGHVQVASKAPPTTTPHPPLTQPPPTPPIPLHTKVPDKTLLSQSNPSLTLTNPNPNQPTLALALTLTNPRLPTHFYTSRHTNPNPSPSPSPSPKPRLPTHFTHDPYTFPHTTPHNTTPTPPLHPHYTPTTPPLHPHYTSSTPHPHYTSSTPPPYTPLHPPLYPSPAARSHRHLRASAQDALPATARRDAAARTQHQAASHVSSE